jgi:hypothetical protein
MLNPFFQIELPLIDKGKKNVFMSKKLYPLPGRDEERTNSQQLCQQNVFMVCCSYFMVFNKNGTMIQEHLNVHDVFPSSWGRFLFVYYYSGKGEREF